MRRYTAVLVLFVMAPLVGEVLLGATPVSRLGGLIPLSALYGGGAVLIRELASRRGSRWGRMALLGAAYAIIEEGLAVQSLFNPDLFHAGALGGRALGVNWVWTEWTIGYHIAWSIAIPVLLAELLLPRQRGIPWLGTRGIIGMGGLYALGAFAIAAIFRVIVTPGFHTPPLLTAGAVIASAALIVAGLIGPRVSSDSLSHRPTTPFRQPPGPWLVGLLTIVAAGLWFGLLALPAALRQGGIVLLPMLLAIAMIASLWTLVSRWSQASSWTDLHKLALAVGPMAASMTFGFVRVTAGNRVDHWGQGVISVVVLFSVAMFARHLSRRAPFHETQGEPMGLGGTASRQARQAF
jgi:hypothetical protein